MTSLLLAYLAGIFTTIAALFLSRRLAESRIAKENERRDNILANSFIYPYERQDGRNDFFIPEKVTPIRKTRPSEGLGGKERA
jgi:hypothetical protein